MSSVLCLRGSIRRAFREGGILVETLIPLIGLAVVSWLVWDFWRTSPSRVRQDRTSTTTSRASSTSHQRSSSGLPPEFDDLDYVLEWFESDDGQGYVLQRLRDRQRKSWQKLDPDNGLYAFYVRLDPELGDDLHDPRFDPGSPLSMRTEERAGEEIVSVWDEDDEIRLGWVSVGDEERVRGMLENAEDPEFMVMWERREAGKRKQVRALLATGDHVIGMLERGQELPG